MFKKKKKEEDVGIQKNTPGSKTDSEKEGFDTPDPSSKLDDLKNSFSEDKQSQEKPKEEFGKNPRWKLSSDFENYDSTEDTSESESDFEKLKNDLKNESEEKPEDSKTSKDSEENLDKHSQDKEDNKPEEKSLAKNKEDSKQIPQEKTNSEEKDKETKSENREQTKEKSEKESEENKTTKLVDKEASFEIPDFSEEDLDFDLGMDEFMPEEKEQDTSESTKYDKELPFLDLSKEKTFVEPNQNNRDIVFVEHDEYLKVLSLKNDLKSYTKKDKGVINKVYSNHETEVKTLEHAKEKLNDMKQSLLYIDRKLFDKKEGDE